MLTDLPARPLDATAPVDPTSIADTTLPPVTPGWSLPARIGFRWFVCYFVLYCLPFPLGFVPGVERRWQALMDLPLSWIGRTVFGLSAVQTGFQTGSGDTTAHYLRSFLFAVLAVLLTTAWTVWRDRPSHRTLAVWFLSYLRYTLALALMGYGVAKVLVMQMPPPDAVRLTEMFGELSPMGLVWAFTGASRAYEIFGGFAELIPGVLLVFRRTALVGAMLAIPVMVNVVLLNFAYDVPVKLYSTHLLVMSIAVIAPNLHRLYGVLLKNCPVAPGDITPPVRDTRLMLVRTIFKAGVLLTVAARFAFVPSLRSARSGASPVYGAIEGAWSVVSFDAPEGTLAWRSLAVGRYQARVRLSNDSAMSVSLDSRAPSDSIPPLAATLRGRDQRMPFAVNLPRNELLTGERVAADTLRIVGTGIRILLARRDLSHMELTSRGFHWVQEYPYNR